MPLRTPRRLTVNAAVVLEAIETTHANAGKSRRRARTPAVRRYSWIEVDPGCGFDDATQLLLMPHTLSLGGRGQQHEAVPVLIVGQGAALS